MRLLIRTIVLASVLAFAIQPSAKAEVASGPYWQYLPDAMRQHNEQIWYATAYWNDVVRWNEAYARAVAEASKPKTTPKTKPQPQVGSESKPQTSGDRFDRLANCESSMRQDAFNGVNKSYFQWAQPTWERVGGVGDPRGASYETQKEKAQYLATIADPRTQWPECWYISAN